MYALINLFVSGFPIYIVLIILIYGYWEAGRLEVNRLELYFENLPEEFDGFIILHISDLHSLRFGRLEKKLCKLVRNQHFDVALFSGDYLLRGISSRARVISILKRIFGHISAPSGIYGIRGNHEKNKFLKHLHKQTNFIPLMEKSVSIKRGESQIWIAGVNRLKPLGKDRGKKSLGKALLKIPTNPQPFIILLAHTPDYVYLAAEKDINLVLCGDTHGGQFCLPFIGALRNKANAGRQFIKGLNRVSQTYIYTSKGVGSSGFPIRIHCRPEITIITLRKREMAFHNKEI